MSFYSDMNQGVGREAGEASLHDSRGPSEVQNRPALLQLCGASYNAISTLSLGETKACCWVVEVNGTRQAQICIHMEACCVVGDQFPESRALRTRQVSFQCVSVCETPNRDELTEKRFILAHNFVGSGGCIGTMARQQSEYDGTKTLK